MSGHQTLDEPVSHRFRGVPLRRALHRLLRDEGYALTLPGAPAGAEQAADAVATLWIAANAGGTDRMPGSPMAVAETDPEERADDVRALGIAGGGDALAQLEAALSDTAAQVREAAIDALVTIGGEAAVEILALALADGEPRIREEAVEAFGEIGGERARGLLAPALDDEVGYVREAAVMCSRSWRQRRTDPPAGSRRGRRSHRIRRPREPRAACTARGQI